jgi:aspartyl-tRNA(Asn)/glutamyl-tRNA(Gln) amidotransferase subunit A
MVPPPSERWRYTSSRSVTRSSERFDPVAPTVAASAAALAAGVVTATELTRNALAEARLPAARAVFTRFRDENALLEASASDALRSACVVPSPLAGLPISIKDLFDISGETTTAGSAALADAPPAARDAEVVRRLRLSGAVLVGRSNMTELAFSGLGLNPHFGTPLNPCEPDAGRIPGGSSSGAAVSVALGIAAAAVGTDTGGSVRIPAALCGLVGFKPTAVRVPLDGAVPLSPSLDSVGPIAHTVACCVAMDKVLSGGADAALPLMTAARCRVAVPQSLVWDDLDRHTATSIEAALVRLSRAGVTLVEIETPELFEIVELNAGGGFAAAESFALHRYLLETRGDALDPRVRIRIERGRQMTATAYLGLVHSRREVQRRFAERMRGFDLWLMPTVPRVAPTLESLATDAAYFEANRLMLRNPSLVNFLDGCAISLPCHDEGTLPVGLSLVAAPGIDRQLLAAAACLEAVVSSM